MTSISWALRAQQDFDQLTIYYDAIDPDVAERIGRRILDATMMLSGLPLAGPIAIGGDRRKWRVSGTPYVICYRPSGDHIRILRVLHAAQDNMST